MFPGAVLPWLASAVGVSRHAARPAFLLAACLLCPLHAGEIESQPLATRSGPRGSTLFSGLPPKETGIVADNAYADPRMWRDRYQEFALGSFGTGVAIGDYDHDGRPDVFVVSKTGECRLFRNLGDWKFQDVTAAAGLTPATARPPRTRAGAQPAVPIDSVEAWKQGAAFADVNNDGWLDLYICRFNAPNLLYINQGDGTFVESAGAFGLDVVDACGMAAFCDYDRDGRLDVYITTNMLDAAREARGHRGHLFHNEGNGSFREVTVEAGVAGEGLTHSATWWDYDGDGWPDLYVGNDFAGADRLFHNNRDGTFTDVLDALAPRTPYSSMGADLGDVNNDGRPDLFVADMAATTHEKDQRGMAISRELTRADRDPPGVTPQLLCNSLLLATGTNRFLEAASLAGIAATDWTWSVRFEDLDDDGRLDLHVTNGMNREYHNSDLRDRILAAENPADRLKLMKASPVLAERNLAFRNLGHLQFEEVGAAWGLDQLGVSFGAAFGDLDGDGDLDLVFSNYEAAPTVLRNDSQEGHRIVIALQGTASNRFGVGARATLESAAGVQVRDLVLARGYLSTGEPILHFGLGADTRIDRLTIDWPSGRRQLFTGLDVDRRYVITEPDGAAPPQVLPATARPTQFAPVPGTLDASASTSDTKRPIPVDPVSRQAFVPFSFYRRGPAAAVADLTGDRQMDILVGPAPQEPAHRLRVGPAGFSSEDLPEFSPASGAAGGPLLVFDADGDGFNDVVLSATGNVLPPTAPGNRLRLFLNDGQGHFRAAAPDALAGFGASVGALAAADFDHDGRIDLFVGARVLSGKYPLPPRSALLANRGGRFEDVTDQAAPGLREAGMVTSAVWADADGDGWPDLVVALDWGGVKYFHNRAGVLEDWSDRAGFAAAGTGWWTSLATADFNGDGRPDFVVGNVGLNTVYHASPQQPALLYYGRFGGSDGPQLVEAYFEGSTEYPRRTAKVLGTKLPSISRRFPRADDYAKATLADVLGAEALSGARRFAATEFRSGVFLSGPDGTWTFHPFPRIAQIAPLQGIAAGDFDGDGFADVFAVQNSSAPMPPSGPFNGGVGQLLHGDGHGGFTPVEPAVSGLVVPGDAKALCVTDLNGDGWPDFFVTQNQGPAMAFQNRGVAGRRGLTVCCAGPLNAAVAGARVTLELADGSRRTGTWSVGSSYYSQSAAACFFGWDEGNRPVRVRVEWADGRTTETTVETGAVLVRVAAPAP